MEPKGVGVDLKLKGAKAIVTAGANGIGLNITERLVNEGANVYICDIDTSALAAAKEKLPTIRTGVCDVSDRSQVAGMVSEATDFLGGLDCLVNNAGIAGPTGLFHEIDPLDWDRCIQVCLTGQFNCARLVVDHLKKSENPSIVNLSSAAGKFGFPNRAPYSAAKWGVVGFTKSLSMELGKHGIRCNAILPGPVDGERIRSVISEKAKIAGKTFEEFTQTWLSMASIKELIDPQQIADLIAFIVSPLGKTISGQALSVDGDMQGLM
jgi:NAD(P)-dependent dehydrogenase (short-subunit alcohol dehydrogenase family)